MVKTFKNLAKSYLNYIKFTALKIIERNGYVLLLKNHYSELCSKLYLYEDETVYLKNYLNSAVKIIDLNCNRYGATENNFEILMKQNNGNHLVSNHRIDLKNIRVVDGLKVA